MSKVLDFHRSESSGGSEVAEGRPRKSSIRCLISHVHLSCRGIDGEQRAYHVEAGATTIIQHEVSRTEGNRRQVVRRLKPGRAKDKSLGIDHEARR